MATREKKSDFKRLTERKGSFIDWEVKRGLWVLGSFSGEVNV